MLDVNILNDQDVGGGVWGCGGVQKLKWVGRFNTYLRLLLTHKLIFDDNYFLKNMHRSRERRVQNLVEHLRWSFSQK